MFGLGLVWMGCHMILKFARMYYDQRKVNYSAEQQSALEALFQAAEAVESVIAVVFAPGA